MPKLNNIDELYKRRLKELVGDSENVKRIESDFYQNWSPEQWYQQLKKRWYFHMTSWYMLQERENTMNIIKVGEGCNQLGCIEQCEYYAPEGRREPEQIQTMIKVLSSFPAVQEAELELEQELHRPMSAILRHAQEEKQLFRLLKGQPFWIWNRHLHFLQFLKTQRKCCFNHIIGEPEKPHCVPHPLY